MKVSVADVRFEHEVKLANFMKWLDRQPRSLRDMSARHEIQAILGNARFRTFIRHEPRRGLIRYEFHSQSLEGGNSKRERHRTAV